MLQIWILTDSWTPFESARCSRVYLVFFLLIITDVATICVHCFDEFCHSGGWSWENSSCRELNSSLHAYQWSWCLRSVFHMIRERQISCRWDRYRRFHSFKADIHSVTVTQWWHPLSYVAASYWRIKMISVHSWCYRTSSPRKVIVYVRTVLISVPFSILTIMIYWS